MTSDAKTPDAYVESLPEDRREAVRKLRETFRANLPEGYEEGMQYGMIGYYVPHSVYPPGYHCDPKQPVPFAGIANQKQYVSVYLMCIYMDPALTERFVGEYGKTGKKLDMGKGCVRFKKMDDIPYDLLGETIARIPVDAFLARYESEIPASKRR